MFDLGIFTGSAKIVTFGLGSVALFGGLWLLIQKLMSGKWSEKTNVVHKIKQAVIQEKIEVITKEQEIITKQLKQAEQASEDSKEKIKNIARKAAVDMNKILKQDTISAIDDSIDADWERL